VLVASGERVEEDPEAIRLFLAALERGTRDAVDDPAAATESLLRANENLDRRLTRAQVAKTLPVLLPRPAGRDYGFMDPDEWREFAGFMVDEDQLVALPDPKDVLTNELLPGKIPE
jgi:ABC-type nitrate/sulfonate/bicarbonate transport system substrate-binding protein